MDFIHFDLGSLKRGDVVEVALSGSAANVRLLDSSNFSKYQKQDRHRYVGGLMKRSPARLGVPSSGRWHVAVDMQGLRGRTNADVRVIPAAALQPLPAISENRAQLREIVENVESEHVDIDGQATEFDVFISHASEDKDAVVRPLADLLKERRLTVWYDEFELRVGDSLRRKIDDGIARSRFGIVVLSTHFFKKQWSQYELDGIVSMTNSQKQRILPLWHEISKDEVLSNSPSLADKVALRTSDYSLEEIAEELVAVVGT